MPTSDTSIIAGAQPYESWSAIAADAPCVIALHTSLVRNYNSTFPPTQRYANSAHEIRQVRLKIVNTSTQLTIYIHGREISLSNAVFIASIIFMLVYKGPFKTKKYCDSSMTTYSCGHTSRLDTTGTFVWIIANLNEISSCSPRICAHSFRI